MNAAKVLLVTPALVLGLLAPAASATADSRLTGKPAAPRCVPPKVAPQSEEDRPPLGHDAVKGFRVGHLPKGFSLGMPTSGGKGAVKEYGYAWTDGRPDADPLRRAMWLRVVCWSKAATLGHLKRLPVTLGPLAKGVRGVTVGGRKVWTKVGGGALGPGRYVGWLDRPGRVVTLMVSPALERELPAIVKGIVAK
ncbi:hypothetical protein [Sinosporangium siamense]|uniref:Uncharacterized protein n=1 Tax=Sinosporangium siamense TaxID=1367973 RepID=A0A919V903_9ACTN|nr:hypothetical protein [Sinosporangium siamense]GII94968.1 hypothetical protein Ssi02_51990 [Sinosporangium siamense]